MRLKPQKAPLYGECVLTVQLDDDDVCRAEEEEEEEEVEFYLLFSGSTQRHVSSTLRVSHITLQAVCPAHNLCEQVLVTLCWARPGGPVDSHSQETFCFVQDLALDVARFLLDSTAPQKVLLFDDEQIPLRECERLDQSLPLALKHLSMPHHRTAQTHTHTDVDRQMCHQAHTITATETHTHSDTERRNTETHKETWMDVPTLLDSRSAASQSQQLSRLLHLAANYGLRTVASLLLQQPGCREALSRTDTLGRTAVCVAESRGHQQLVELFTAYDSSSGIQVEPKEDLHFYQEGRMFQHHAILDTYTLTSAGCWQREGGSETDSVQEEVRELRRLIQIHRDSKVESGFAGTTTATLVSPACARQLCSSRLETRQDAGLAVVNTENCSTAPEEQGSTPSLDERKEGAGPVVVTHTSCTKGHRCKSQEAGKGLRATPAANSPAGRNRENKKRTTKRRAAEFAVNRNSLEAGRGTAWGATKITGSGPEKKGTVSAVASVLGDRGATETLHSPGAQGTPLPSEPESALGGDGTCAGRKAVALPTTIVVEKQEGEEWEVDVLICERATETETEIETESPPERRDQLTSALGSAAQRTVIMGQEQSRHPQESQSDSEEPKQQDSTNKSSQSGSRSPDSERKPRRVLWRDGGWIGSTMGSHPRGLETLPKTVWYQGENLDQDASEASQRQEVNSQSVWYDSDIIYERKHEQLEQAECDLSSAQAPGLHPPQLLEQALISRQECVALSQPHAAGAQPALSHGPAAQRREVHGSQQEEEVGPDWKEGGMAGGRGEVGLTETTYGRESCEAADIEETGEEKPGGRERGAKGRKKRRKKRGRRGGAEAKLSSSSSIESQSQSETQTHREAVTNLGPQSETESEAQDLTGRALIQSNVSEPACKEEADKDAMHLPCQTETQTMDSHGLDCDITASESSYTGTTDHGRTGLTEATGTKESSEDKNQSLHDDFNPDSAIAASDLSQTVFTEADIEEITTVPPGGKEILNPSGLESQGAATPVQQTVGSIDTEHLTAAGEARASEDQTGLLESKPAKELPVRHSDPTELTEDSSLVEFPEQNTQHLQSVCSAEAVGLPWEGRADGSPLQIQEGSTVTTVREYLDCHCLASEMLGYQQLEEEKRHALWVGVEGEGKETSVESMTEGKDSRMVCGEESSSSDREEKAEDEGIPSSHRETEQCYENSLLATAVAVVTVAVVSAVVSIELSQQPASSPSDSQQSANDTLLVQDTNFPADTLKQLKDHQSRQLTNKRETRHLSAETATETEDQQVYHPHPDPPEGPANTDMSEESHCAQVESETAAQLHHRDLSAPAYTPTLPQLQKEEVQPDTTQNNLFQVHMKPADETITAEEGNQAHLQTETQLSCPGVDAGQDPESPHTLCPKSESVGNPQDQCQVRETQDRDQGLPVESPTALGEGGRQVQEQDSPGDLESKTEEKVSCQRGVTDCQAKRCDSLNPPYEGEGPTVTLPVGPCVSAPVADPSPDEPTAPMSVETGESQSPQSLVDMNLITATFHSKGTESVAGDDENGLCDEDPDSVDTVDGWKQRERDKMEREEVAWKHVVTAEDTPHTEPEQQQQQQSEQTRRGSDSIHPLQIQREGDVFYPAQPRPQPSTQTSFADVRPETEECVSVCVSHRDTDSLTVSAELDDSVFKKVLNPYNTHTHTHTQLVKVCTSFLNLTKRKTSEGTVT